MGLEPMDLAVIELGSRGGLSRIKVGKGQASIVVLPYRDLEVGLHLVIDFDSTCYCLYKFSKWKDFSHRDEQCVILYHHG
jgi:hypothetical protein